MPALTAGATGSRNSGQEAPRRAVPAIVDLFATLIQLIFALALVLAAVAVWSYTSLRRLAENVKDAQSNVDMALRKKVSLINRLTEMANQYREGERLVTLKGPDQFKKLRPAVDRAETDLRNWRVRCNATIKDYNSRRSALPHALYAGVLGFRPARSLELESMESSDSMIERPAFSADGVQVKALFGMGRATMLGASKTPPSQGKLRAEKAAT